VRQKGVVFRTTLTTKECADVFRGAAKSARGLNAKIGELGAKIAGNDNSGFFTPTFEPSPFAAVDNETVPSFAVGVFIGKFGAGAQGAGTAVHMYVDEAPDTREVQIVSPHTLTGGMRSGRFVRKFFGFFRDADPQLDIVDGNVNVSSGAGAL
jgi:hypothetical protein